MAPEPTRPDNDTAGDPLAARLEHAAQGDIAIQRVLGEGRTARVYLADQRSLDRQVAVKVLLPKHARDRKAVLRFKREARAMAGCPHPGIVSVFTVGETADGLPFFVMEYIEGKTLELRLQGRGKLSLQETVRIVTAVADAITYAHQRGLVHRDVKPANVLVESHTGRVLITDFGMAKVVSGNSLATTLTGSGEVVGTPAYISPEQAESGTVDPRSDQYSLAVMTYEMLSGRLPFSGPGPQDFVRQHAQDTPPLLRQAEETVPAEIAAVVDRGLMKEPGARFASAEAFGQALRGAASAIGGQPRPAPSLARGRERRLLQVIAIYAGAAWGALEALSWLIETYGLPIGLREVGLWIVIAAFPLTLVIFWLRMRATDRDAPAAD
jgi:serine/threonine-protein kinase